MRFSNLAATLLLATCVSSVALSPSPQKEPAGGPHTIEVTEVPPSDCGGPGKRAQIAGRVIGNVAKGHKIVIYSQACNGVLYVQPTIASPYTALSDKSWNAYIHLGHTYYVLLVGEGFKPVLETTDVPQKSSAVLAVATVSGKKK